MTAQAILNHCDKVRNAGQDKWRIPCPSHGGKGFNMMISERSDGSVGAHCFVCGANGVDLIESLNLPMKELFAPDSEYQRPVVTKKMQTQAQEDEAVLMVAKGYKERGERMTLEDKRRVRLAKARLEGIQQLQAQ